MEKSKTFIFIIFLILITTYAYAGEFSGTFTYTGGYNLQTNKLNNTLKLELKYTENFTDELFVEGDFVLKYTDKPFAPPFIFMPKEAYLGAYDLISNLDLRAGFLIISWGASDMFSPLDNFNPIPPEMSIGSLPEKRGVLGVDATYYIDDDTYLQVVYLLKFAPSMMPPEAEENMYLGMFAPQFASQGINITSVNITHNTPQGPAWGIKLARSFESFDAALSYYNGYYMSSFVHSMVPDPATGTLDLTLSNPKKQVFGLEFQGDFPGIEGATLRGDIAYIIPQPWQLNGQDVLKDPYVKASIGADYKTSSDLYINLGYMYGFMTEEGDKCSPYMYLILKQPIKDTDLTPIYTGLISLKDGSMLHSIGVEYKVTDDLSITLSYVKVLGDDTSKLGAMKRAEGIYLSGEWSF